MPKVIDVTLVGISGDFTKDVQAAGVAVKGNLFGAVFNGIPEEKQAIFTFPNGPIAIHHGQVELIDATKSFSLRNPSQDPPGIFGESLRFGGNLKLVATGQTIFKHDKVTTFTLTQVGVKHEHIVRFISGSQEIKVTFVLTVTDSS